MRKPLLRVISDAIDIRGRLLLLLREMGDVEVSEVGIPDLICIGCDRQLSLRDLERAKKCSYGTKVPIVLVAWNGSEELAVAALRNGIDDYVRGANYLTELPRVLLSLCASRPNTSVASCELLVGDSDFTRTTRNYIERVARASSNVLVTGETGTGKELVAKLIHRNSPRAEKALVCINCAAIPDTLLESELFGFERGAFTGANNSRDGNLVAADGGTAFLDEIGDMSPYAQAKILRAIETREIQRLGGGKTQYVDFRVVAATNRDLESLSQDGQFRRDLFFRLNVARIHMPPLRERPEDLLPLAHHFRMEFNRSFGRNTLGFTQRSEQAILNYPWPGNVRELRNIIEASFITLDPECQWVEMPDFFCSTVEDKNVGVDEGDRILRALSESGWNKSKAADILSWSRMTLYRKMERHGISAEPQPARSSKF
jgi:transcriptional regulator with GAF, ATPase, and Fis domain